MQESSGEQFVGKVSQRGIIEHDGRILISRDVYDEAIWELPGGRLHIGEEPRAGLQREIKEELGVDIEVGPIVYTEQFYQSRTGEPHLLLVYRARLESADSGFALAPDEVAEVKWISASELGEQKVYDNCEHALRAYFGVV